MGASGARNTQEASRALSEIDYRALRLMMERSDGSRLVKGRAVKQFDRAWRRGALAVPANETSKQRWWRCEARFLLGDYGDWSGWEHRDPWAERIWYENPFEVPVWNPDQPCGRLYVIGEQGIGDEVMFAQCIEDARRRVGEIVIETQGKLRETFERCLGVRTAEANIGEDGIRRKQEFDADAWVSIGDLPRLFRRNTFPRTAYLSALPDGRYRGKTLVSWRGAQGEIALETMRAIAGNDALSVQYDQTWDEDIERVDVDLLGDIGGIMRALAACERLVSVSTTVAHLAAAMGVPTTVIIADPKTGVRGNIMPWRWISLAHPQRSRWYGNHVRTFQSVQEYRALCRW